MSKKIICGQINIPETDNSSPCKDFMYSECVKIDRKSNLIRGSKGMTMNEYSIALESEIRLLKLQNKNMKQILENLITMFPEVGIGVYED